MNGATVMPVQSIVDWLKEPRARLLLEQTRHTPHVARHFGERLRFQLREKLPHLKGVVSYTARHSFATQALVNGVGLAHLAELMGHVDTSMVSSHEAHLAGNLKTMQEAANRATGG